MKHAEFNVKLQIQLMKEGDTIVVNCPALDLCGYGASAEEAKKDFDAALKIFIKETVDKGTLEKALEELGWKKVVVNNRPTWTPQIEVLNSNIEEEISLPLSA